MTLNFFDRTKACLTHLLLSLVVIIAIVALTYFIWFPNGLIKSGAINGLKIIFLVDLILGPTLTFVVFNKAKKSLKWDLIMIVLIQLSGLVYGTYIVYQERPVIVVLSTDAVHIFTASELIEWDLPLSYISHTGPKNYYLQANNDFTESALEQTAYEMIQLKPYATQTVLYQHLANVDKKLLQQRIALVKERMDKDQLRITTKLIESSKTSGCSWLQVSSKHINHGYVCFSGSDGIKSVEITTTLSNISTQ